MRSPPQRCFPQQDGLCCSEFASVQVAITGSLPLGALSLWRRLLCLNVRVCPIPRASTEEGKRRSRQNALRHGLTAETVVGALEDAADYAAFEMAVTADFDAHSAVERELVLRLASLLWRLRRASAIEAGLFNIQARELLGRRRHVHRQRHNVVGTIPGNATRREDDAQQTPDKHVHTFDDNSPATLGLDDQSDALTQSFLQLTDLPTSPLDRLSRYEATLWRQACQILWTLQCLDRRKPWERHRRARASF